MLWDWYTKNCPSMENDHNDFSPTNPTFPPNGPLPKKRYTYECATSFVLYHGTYDSNTSYSFSLASTRNMIRQRHQCRSTPTILGP